MEFAYVSEIAYDPHLFGPKFSQSFVPLHPSTSLSKQQSTIHTKEASPHNKLTTPKITLSGGLLSEDVAFTACGEEKLE